MNIAISNLLPTSSQVADSAGTACIPPQAVPDACRKCGTERFWCRGGKTKDGTIRWKAKCAPCHRESLAKDRAKWGGAAARNKRWEAKNADKNRAHKLVEVHLRNGNIVRRPCVVCGDKDAHAHHEDYAVPLEIVWLCPIHHSDRHRQIALEAAE